MGTKAYWIILVIALMLAFILGYQFHKPQVVEKTKVKVDTVYIKQPPQIIYKTAVITKLDTVIKRDTTVIRDTIRVAYADTTFKEGELRTWYYFPPVNKFKFDWRPYPQPVITRVETKTIVIRPKWYENKYLWGIAGLCIGIAIR